MQRDNIRTYSNDERLIASRREHIAKCAAHILVKKGYDRTSIREIADACNMGMGTLYRYVGAKEDVLYLVIRDGLSKYVRFCEEVFEELDNLRPVEALKHAIRQYYTMVDNSQDLMLFAFQETKNLLPEAQEAILNLDRRIVEAFEKLLLKGCEEGEFKITDTRLAAHNIVIAGQMWAVRRWFFKRQLKLEDYIELQTEMILASIIPRPP